MRLMLIDRDECYQKQFRQVVSQQIEMVIEVITLSTVQEFQELYNIGFTETYLLLHEDFLDEFVVNQDCLEILDLMPFGILSEGDIQTNSFEDKVGVSNLSFQIKDKLICKENFISKDKLIHKYQPIKELMEIIKDSYLNESTHNCLIRNLSTQLIFQYIPYGNEAISKNLETILSKVNHAFKTLLIHYDPFHEASNNQLFNLSYLFTQIRRSKENLPLILKEIVKHKSDKLDILYGPLHMLDVDCLSESENHRYVELLLNQLDYDLIVLNINGCHLSKHIIELLNVSHHQILVSQNENVQLSVTRQFKNAWNLDLYNEHQSLKEVIISVTNNRSH